MEILRGLATDVRNDTAFKDIVLAAPDILGVDRINGREVIYPINLRVRANQRDGVLRELRRRMIKTFEKEGIPLGNASSLLIMQHNDPTAPPAQQPLTG